MQQAGLEKDLITQGIVADERSSLTGVSQSLLGSRTTGTVSKTQHRKFPQEDNDAGCCAQAVGGDVVELDPSKAQVARAGNVVMYMMSCMLL